jgi:site-specific recombinase XerD
VRTGSLGSRRYLRGAKHLHSHLARLAGRSCPDIRWHDLRDPCATLLLKRGVHSKLVQHLLGHDSITMTLDRYSHWLLSLGRHAADGMDEVLG